MTTLGEFELIARYLTRPCAERQGVGDDCALIDAGATTLALTTDLLVEGVHFFPGAEPAALGHKSLAVNLSDLAAAGARPRCFLLSLVLPCADPAWLEAFARGLFALADAQGCALVGGDTAHAPRLQAGPGPLTISITAVGEVERGAWRGRAGARPGDDIWVSGRLGDAALALAVRRGLVAGLSAETLATCCERMDRPMPRVELGRALAGRASAAVDVSDGLVGDLAHILERSQVGALVHWPRVPRAPYFDALDVALQQQLALAGGDDYELIFTAEPARREEIAALAAGGVAVTRIGSVEKVPGLRLVDGNGAPIETKLAAYDHFAPGD